MNIARQVLFLREELGLSYRQIAKMVYGRADSKTILKVNGIHKTYMRRYNASKINVITKQGVITGDNIVDTINYYSLEKILDDHNILFTGDLREERIKLARMLKYIDDEEKRRDIYRRLNRIKLLELVFIVYDLMGLAQHDRTRIYLYMLYSVAKKVVDRVDLDHDGVKTTSRGIKYLNGEAAAYVYVVFFTVLHNTQFYWMLDRLNEIIYSLTTEKSKRKKIEKIKEIIARKYSDILSSAILRI